MRRVLITGASGLVGRIASSALSDSGWDVAPLRRGDGKAPNTWDIESNHIQLDPTHPFDAVIHLAGENIATGRWTAGKKQRIRDSRVNGTRLLSEHLAELPSKPKVLLSASASGFYGDRGDEVLTEASTRGDGFLPETCAEWEAATKPAEAAGIRVVHMRFAMVLSPEGGALNKVLPLFRLGLGGRLGSGMQIWSWTDLNDLVRAMIFCLGEDSLRGAVNFSSPEPVTNREFTHSLAQALGRPAFLPAPAFGLRLALGEMADGLLLSSAKMLPEKLMNAGFKFESPSLGAAFSGLS